VWRWTISAGARNWLKRRGELRCGDGGVRVAGRVQDDGTGSCLNVRFGTRTTATMHAPSSTAAGACLVFYSGIPAIAGTMRSLICSSEEHDPPSPQHLSSFSLGRYLQVTPGDK